MKHKHADLIHAWADGAEIQWKNRNGQWEDMGEPLWNENHEYRIKPEPKPDIVMYFEIRKPYGEILPSPFHNIKATYDGETGALKLAEVLSRG